MITGFESYTLKAWSDVCGLMVSGKPHKMPARPQQGTMKRAGEKRSTTLLMTVGVAHLVISSLFFTTSCSAVAVPTPITDIHDLDIARPKSSKTVSLSLIRDINQSFNMLFDSIRTGQMLIPAENIRLLAQKALLSQKESVVDIDSWAHDLANDVKGAND